MLPNHLLPGPLARHLLHTGLQALQARLAPHPAPAQAPSPHFAGGAQLLHLAALQQGAGHPQHLPHPHLPHLPHLSHVPHLPHRHHHHHRGFAPPAALHPQVPLGVTDFVAHQVLPRHLHTRHGGELQALVVHGQPLGVMTRYPVRTRDVAAMLKCALRSSAPRIVNLMNPGDMGIPHSYVDRMPEGRPCRIGPLDVVRQTVGRQALGPNGHGGDLVQVRTLLHVRDRSQPLHPWRTIDHEAIQGWVDTARLPPRTFEHLWRSIYQPGRIDQGVVHCAGGVGRTPTLMWRLAFQSFLDQANRQGRLVTRAETANFLDKLTQEARAMRGNQVLPDEGQIRMLYESCLAYLPYQRVAQAPFR
ncbi:hypothetical protein GN316_03390 [Xylophilus sp. Kf1]|nr:hypothetical protein [Xylophilus sp. Kf1]